MEIPLPTSRYDISRAVAPKCLDDPPVDRDRRYAHPGSKATQGLLVTDLHYKDVFMNRVAKMLRIQERGFWHPNLAPFFRSRAEIAQLGER
ncbi:hypothetical protein TNCV_3554971 [Trichonephila clavipes]|nr:hypothetical protein TNCV_3554971 [Trichonephila clavipes]